MASCWRRALLALLSLTSFSSFFEPNNAFVVEGFTVASSAPAAAGNGGLRTSMIHSSSSSSHQRQSSFQLAMGNMFQDMLDKAFSNDDTLSQDDKRLGGIDEAPEGDDEEAAQQARRVQELTATQRAWRSKMGLESSGVTAQDLADSSKINLDLFLAGVPDKDPSNDLFGTKVNISSRDRSTGLNVPEEPTVAGVPLQFLPNGQVQVMVNGADSSGKDNNWSFVDASQTGDWVLSADGTQIRFRLAVTGYTRRIVTKGTIQKVFWSQDDEKTTATSTEYTIPAGWLYAECALSKKVGRDNTVAVEFDNGVLKVEQKVGLLGAATKLVPCGKFNARQEQ